jgi:hypothetical protein
VAAVRIRRSIDVNASATDAWTLLADGFGDIADWTTAVASSSLVGDRVEVGAERHCQISGPGSGDGLAVERVTAFDSDAMSYAYELVHGPGFIRSARNVLSVRPLGPNRTRISADGKLTLPWWLVPLNPVVSIAIGSGARRFLRDLQYRLEHGSPRPGVVAARAGRPRRAMPR